MDLNELIRPGMSREETFPVGDEQTAIHLGSGSSRVLATPWMIAFMERVSHRLLAERLPQGTSSVGVLVEVEHLAPTPVSAEVRVRSEVQEVAGIRVTFAVEARDAQELVGRGVHRRVVIDEARFLRRVESKRQEPA